MRAPAALANTNDLLQELFCFLSTGDTLDPFTKARMLKEASKQTTLDRMYTLEAYVHTIAGDRDLAKDSAIKALNCIDDPATISSCLSVLQLNAFPLVAIEQVKQLQNYLDAPEFLSSFSSFFTVYPDVLLMERAMTKLEKMELTSSDDLSDLYSYFNGVCRTIDIATEQLGFDKSECSRVIEVASSVIENAGIVLHATNIERNPESEWLSIILHVETENTRELAELNWELVGELIHNELNSPAIVTRCEMVDPNNSIARLRYAD
ncbi:TPA: hypothetical protein ACPJZ8_000318 [Vibrio diabolicus]|uniref:hypothetical protein n=1 Tax=Vibrio alginolyticus TaxID=663 RepID=UPI001BD22C69|nr:hypothetical protein [Vibrio alginolyticus]MBS9937601.1 hypothetical protein [Vibrio alginolyticus]